MKVSVIIATFNAAKSIKSAIDSVICQTYKDWECVIVDGVSKDETISIIQDYVHSDCRIRYVSEPDNGIYDAMNKGVNLAKGEWIYVLGADDTLLPTALEAFSRHMEDSDLIYANFFSKSALGDIHKSISHPLAKMPLVMPTSHQAMIMKKSLILECGGFDLSFSSRADNNLVTCAWVRGYKFKRIDDYISTMSSAGFSSRRNDTIRQIYRIYKGNKATSFPLFWAFVYGSKWYLAKYINPIRRLITH